MTDGTREQLQLLLNAIDLPGALESVPALIQGLGFVYYSFAFENPHHTTTQSNLPNHWLVQYEQRNFKDVDPVLTHCQGSHLPLLWDAKTFAHKSPIWDVANACGLRHGWVQPVHAGQTHSSLTVLRPRHSVSTQELYDKAAQVIYLAEYLHRVAAAHFSVNGDHAPDEPFSHRLRSRDGQ